MDGFHLWSCFIAPLFLFLQPPLFLSPHVTRDGSFLVQYGPYGFELHFLGCMLLGEIHVAAAASSSSLRSITLLGVSAVMDAMHDDASRGISTLV